jgi:acetyl-CoA C-acetyltransferase
MTGARPVLVGVGAAARLPDAVELMAAAAEAAAVDAGGAGLLRAVRKVYVARGSWSHPDPGREVTTRFGATARTAVAELGILQQSLVTRACLDITAGHADVVLVLGAESAHSDRFRLGAGRPTGKATTGPDEILAPTDDILAPLEIRRGMYLPVRQYAVLESALRAADGQGLAEHAAEVARLWAGFSRVAAGNDEAWSRSPVAPEDLAASERNPMMSSPYTRSHCSRAGVDQGAALLLCSTEAARRLGVPLDRWVFPVAAAESNVMVPVAARPELARSPGFGAVGRRLTTLTGRGPADADLVDLYSCFPAAVRLQTRELGLTDRADLSVTGGMTFAGGPLNNYVFQATVTMAGLLRATPEAQGLVTCVSGMVTKQGGMVWSASPSSGGFRAEDVSAEVRAAEQPLPLVDAGTDAAGRIVGFTVAWEKGEPVQAQAVLTLDAADGPVRTVATSTDPDVLAAMSTEDWVGRTVTVRGDTLLI